MLISTKGRYALRVMLALAGNTKDGYLSLPAIAAGEDLSLKYCEGIMASLSHAGLIGSVPGKGGGYRLLAPPEQCRIGDVLRVTEPSLAPVACLEAGAPPCARAADCRTRPLWVGLEACVNAYLDSYTLADLLQAPQKENTANV